MWTGESWESGDIRPRNKKRLEKDEFPVWLSLFGSCEVGVLLELTEYYHYYSRISSESNHLIIGIILFLLINQKLIFIFCSSGASPFCT
jgi:hypothetical protein